MTATNSSANNILDEENSTMSFPWIKFKSVDLRERMLPAVTLTSCNGATKMNDGAYLESEIKPMDGPKASLVGPTYI